MNKYKFQLVIYDAVKYFEPLVPLESQEDEGFVALFVLILSLIFNEPNYICFSLHCSLSPTSFVQKCRCSGTRCVAEERQALVRAGGFWATCQLLDGRQARISSN